MLLFSKHLLWCRLGARTFGALLPNLFAKYRPNH